jgi:hypothetical protein
MIIGDEEPTTLSDLYPHNVYPHNVLLRGEGLTGGYNKLSSEQI